MKASLQAFAAAVLLLATTGCVGISMHSMHPMKVTIQELPSANPLTNTVIRVSYDYDSYGWFWLARTPRPTEAITDSNGHAYIKIADFRYMIHLSAGDFGYRLNRELVRNGGELQLGEHPAKGRTPRKAILVLTPAP